MHFLKMINLIYIKYYKGVDLEKYKDKIRKITNDFPHLNEKGEVI